ncbi:MAG: DUF177 domain-containing protein [Clostridia bacterium]|nr:DUF177 domain-containing protein [Clostridia bacterium]
MVIDVKKLKYSGKDECSFHFDAEFDDALITLPDAKFLSPVSVTGTVTIGGNTVLAEGEIEYSVGGQCSRCLDSAIFHNIVAFSEEFSNRKDADPDVYPYAKGLVDLSDMVREKIIFSMPFAIYCRDDCKGLCPVCGANLNKSQCDCNK